MISEDTCVHCNLPIPPPDLVIDEINGQKLRFCCQGCRGVYRIITGAGLNHFYRTREWQEEGLPAGVFETEYDDASLAGHVIPKNASSARIGLIVEGIRCASCIWLLEKLLAGQPGVVAIRINYGTHQAQVDFNPQQTTPAAIFAGISRLGYLPHPYSPGAAQLAAAREQRSLLIRFGTAAFFSMQLMGFSFALYGGYFHGIDPQIRSLIQSFAAAVATPVVFYSGWPFFAGAWRSLKNRSPSMDLLITLGVSTAYTYSLVALFHGGEVYFDTAAMIITLILLGRLFESSARKRSISAVDKLLQLAPESATRLDGDQRSVVASSSLSPGETILVKPGERIPVDCLVQEGTTEVDESTITGEPMPVLRQSGDRVSAGSLNLTASVILLVDRVAADSFIARIARLVEEAQHRKAPIQSVADRVATVFVPLVISVAVATWFYWFFKQSPDSNPWLNAVSVLIVACPCALGLATPTAVLAASGSAAARGIVFRGGDIIEMTARIHLVAFDKTGTLTHGQPTVEEVLPAAGHTAAEVLETAARAESGSGHPLATAIIHQAQAIGLQPGTPRSVITIPGRGVSMESDQGALLVGSRTFLTDRGVDITSHASGNRTEVHVSRNGRFLGTILLRDTLREEARNTVKRLQQAELKTVLLTGDRRQSAQEVCAKLTIADFHADLSPTDKARWIKARQQQGQVVMMVGDGINDAPALSSSDVGCAMAGGTDIALETSDLVLTKPHLGRLYEAVFIARKAMLVIKQNLFWAFTYNMVTIPLAASGTLEPVWAAAAMASSSVLVVSNSLRLGRQIRKTFSVASQTASN